jgi:hypothetical protein
VKKNYLAFLFFAFLGFFLSPVSSASNIQGDIVDQEDYDPETPYYQIMPPNWTFGFRAAIGSFPIKSAEGNVYEVYTERMVPFQKLGIFSLGIHLGIAPFTSTHYENLKYGALVRYQLHIFKNQIIVPTVAYVYDGFRLKNETGSVDSLSSTGPMFGGLINLGFFDSSTARDGFESIGLLRSYLALEVRPLSLSSSSFSTKSNLWLVGIRLETE